MKEKQLETWELWYPKAGAFGLSFSRSQIDPVETLLVHSAPEVLSVSVHDADGSIKAEGKDLQQTADTPMTRLSCTGSRVEREDIWPGEGEIGMIVLLPGGEAGRLLEWWNADDRSEWRWQVEFYNHR